MKRRRATAAEKRAADPAYEKFVDAAANGKAADRINSVIPPGDRMTVMGLGAACGSCTSLTTRGGRCGGVASTRRRRPICHSVFASLNARIAFLAVRTFFAWAGGARTPAAPTPVAAGEVA